MKAGNRMIAGSMIILSTIFVLSLLLALVHKGPDAFATLSLACMFVIFCFAGAFLYTVLKYRGIRDMVLSVFVVTLVHLLIFKITEPAYFIEFFLYYAALGASVLTYHEAVVPRMRRVRIGKFILLTALIVVLYSAVTIVASLFSSGRSLSQSLIAIATVHTFTGITLGLGLEVGELLTGKLVPESLEVTVDDS